MQLYDENQLNLLYTQQHIQKCNEGYIYDKFNDRFCVLYTFLYTEKIKNKITIILSCSKTV